MNDIKTIVLTTDFSETSRKAVEPALTIARRCGAKIVLVHVADLLPPLIVEYTAIDLVDLEKRQRAHAHEELARFGALHLGTDMAIESVVLLGVAHTEIVKLARERQADLIVMATHGRGLVTHLLMGSTTERVLRQAPCPVMVVRAAETP